jgi:hypothetical protein
LQLSGSIPNFNLSKLKVLNLHNNQLSGAIPNFNLPNLEQLWLFNNTLSATIPDFNLPALQFVRLDNNALTGVIPRFSNSPILSSLNLSFNQLSGSIPNFTQTNLTQLSLNDNQLSGCLPIGLKALCGKLVYLNNNPSLATQDFTAFCSNNLGSCTPQYCASKGTLPWEYWVANVKLGSINNTSDKFKDFNTLGYSDYTNLTTTLSKGQSYPLSISPGLSWVGNVPNAYARAWIDFNNNKIFEANELVLEKTNANPLISNVLVPTTAVTGAVRMRVSVKFGSYPTACETFDKGEVEDYTINISGTTVDPCLTDVTPPVFSNCPQNILKDVFDPGCQSFDWTPPTATDNCTTTSSVSFVSKRGNRILSETPQSVFIQLCPFAPSSSIDTIVYTAKDAKGNSSTCSFELKFINQCQIQQTIGKLPRNVVLTTTGNCAAYKWQVPITYFPCQKGPTPYSPYSLISTNPTVTVVRTPPSCQYCPELPLDSACFSIGRTVLIYNLDTFHVFVQKVSTGSADVALSITSTPSVFTKYTTQIFKIKAQNVVNQALTNVKIEFKRPAQTSNGGAKTASIGTFSDFCPGGIECSEWTIPTLAAGATATLDAPVFILDPTTAIVATTKLLTSTPVDGNVANNSASVTLTPAAPVPAIQSLSRQKPTQYLSIIVQSVAPNPTEGDVVIEVESLREQTVQFEFSNTMGQVIRTEKRPLEKGTNQVKFDVYEFPDGVYLIQTDVNRGRFTPTKFVKF